LEKRVVALVLAGHAVITIDNTDHPLGGELLCQLLTQPLVNIRPLGGSKNVMVPNTFFLAATGNNLVLVGDLTRRALVGRIDPHVERPELRDFKFDPVALAKRARPMLIVKALTVIRAYAMSGERPTETPLGSFEVWSKMVRSALTWLGEADPCDVMERTRGHDPKLAALRAVAAAWLEAIGADKGVLVRDVRQKAQETLPRGAAFGDEGDPAHPELRDALRAVAAGQGAEYISPTRLGEWLKKNAQRIVSCGADGSPYRFAVDGTAHSATKWKLEAVPK
jgi:putative DNA primase/helicase